METVKVSLFFNHWQTLAMIPPKKTIAERAISQKRGGFDALQHRIKPISNDKNRLYLDFSDIPPCKQSNINKDLNQTQKLKQ